LRSGAEHGEGWGATRTGRLSDTSMLLTRLRSWACC
jgi:hypothetical protein